MTRRQIQLAKEALLIQQNLYLRLAASCEPEEVKGFMEHVEACAAAIQLFDGMDKP